MACTPQKTPGKTCGLYDLYCASLPLIKVNPNTTKLQTNTDTIMTTPADNDEDTNEGEEHDLETLTSEIASLQKANKDLKKTRDTLKKDKQRNLETLKDKLIKQTKNNKKKIKQLEGNVTGLKDQINSLWTEMAAYSIIRGYPKTETIQRRKRGSKNKGISCIVCVTHLCLFQFRYLSHIHNSLFFLNR